MATEEAIMRAIADKAMTQRDVAQIYAILLQSGPDGANWARINRAIMDRWPSGLERIKRLAWRSHAAQEVRSDDGRPDS